MNSTCCVGYEDCRTLQTYLSCFRLYSVALQKAKRVTKRRRVISAMPNINLSLISCSSDSLSWFVAFISEPERKERKCNGVRMAEQRQKSPPPCGVLTAYSSSLLLGNAKAKATPCGQVLCSGPFNLHGHGGGSAPSSGLPIHRCLCIGPWHTAASEGQNLSLHSGYQMSKCVCSRLS